MRTSIDTTRWYDRAWAALIFFTRLPFWRLHEPPRECYSRVVEFWPLTGWLTGGLMALVLYVASLFLPYTVAVILAIGVRMLITGALHEDGLADFFDGMGGGGKQRQRILDIMKDSHIGTFGVLGLLVYVLLLAATLSSLRPDIAALTIFAADPYAKMVSSQIVMMLPYARNEQESKAKTVYRKFSVGAGIGLALQGILPLILFITVTGVAWEAIVLLPAITYYFLYMLINRTLGGYTGDCCGAVCLLVELTFCLVVSSTIYSYGL